ncbi:MAG: VWA domain-containing protein [candidate division Zixibacteria bacterium]|nr:VWA domain-containing protein [candidate division Zixibacteria bacterium]
MFNFLNSAVLIAAAAALIPLLIHLFSKRRVKIVPFSSLKHLKEMQKRQVRRIKIRQLLLLVLRMLIILAAVLAFARPATRGGYIGSHAGVSSAILLDRSASMQRQVKDGQLFDLAKNKVAEILKNFGQSDEVILIPFDRQTYFPAGEQFFNREVASRILTDLKPGFERSELSGAFKKAAELLTKARNLNKELYLVTDFQINSLPEQPDSAPQGVTIYFVDLPLETDGNCGVINADLGGQLIEAGNDFTVRTEIENYDDRTKTEQLASLFVDGTRVMQSEFRLEPKGKQTVTFRHAVPTAGFHSGWVEIGDDGFSPDNRSYFTFKIPQQFNILIVSGDASGGLIRLALVPSEELARYWSVKNVSADQLSSIRLSDYDVVVIAGTKVLGPAETMQLLHYTDGGGGLFYILGADIDANYFNGAFGSKIDLTVIKRPPLDFSGAGYYTLERLDYGHPIFKAFAFSQKENLPTFRFFALPTIKDGHGNSDLAYFSNGAPALVEGRHGMGRIMVLTAPITPAYSDLATHSFFVPFVIRTMEYLAGDISSYELKNYVGEKITRSLPERLVEPGSVQLVTPEEQEYSLAGADKSGQIIFDCRPIDFPGIYQLKNDRRTIDLFPANVPASEGDLTAAVNDQVKKSLSLEKFTVIPYARASAAIVTETRFGRELWKIFLWAAALLMAVEMILSREKEPTLEEQ